MPPTPPSSSHPIAYVQTFSADGSRQREGAVSCTRRSETVSVSTCAHCPRFLKTTVESEEDVLHCVSEPETTRSLEALTPLSLPRLSVSAIMTRNVVCVRPDLTLDAVVALFVESGLHSAPVVDHEGKLIGFVNEPDVMLDVQAAQGAGATTVGEVMMPYALSLPESASITRAAAVMAFEGQTRVAIVSRSNTVVGVLSASDILFWLARADGHLLPRPRAR